MRGYIIDKNGSNTGPADITEDKYADIIGYTPISSGKLYVSDVGYTVIYDIGCMSRDPLTYTAKGVCKDGSIISLLAGTLILFSDDGSDLSDEGIALITSNMKDNVLMCTEPPISESISI